MSVFSDCLIVAHRGYAHLWEITTPQLPKPWLALPVDAAVATASGSGAPAPLHEIGRKSASC